ncbi:ammonia-forming cytochrome c nitrite reductase subunit c552 [Scrofimicrobium canadense]|uniref:ammonia-forming cytochrome c nitrite reductase subunit c552 n=1 Tax=Scrofimicrobium canadense TaxID=2652290 RepID=UPI00298DFB64|nr:ammonia-forming cytochrome c nitrite reductase subunit c552 [Scrofimicrobium canadense]
MSENTPHNKRSINRTWLLIVAVVVTAILTFVITALLINIFEKKSQGSTSFAKVVEIDSHTADPAVWGKNFPTQYEDYLKTGEFTQSAHGGTLVAPVQEDDPRESITSSKIEEDPRLKVMWAGYPFSVDYRHARGHEYMKIDQENTLRVKEFNQPGACLNCHVSTPILMEELGNGDLDQGFAEMNKMSFADASALAEHPVTCIDCHDPETMDLVITRPALKNALNKLKASEGIEDYDVNRDATRQEMRSYVCAQCHVEYYFAGEEKTLTFPWAQGLDIDDEWNYYASMETPHVDYVHATTEASILKAQHPEFEIWSQGVHAANGVSCADCHMNYKKEGAEKVSNHHITSPTADLNASCGTCHDTDDGVLEERITTIQDRFLESRDRAMDALVDLVDDIETAMDEGVSEEQLNLARHYQNKASFYADYVYSENSYGFHAPDYIQRILSTSLDASRKGQMALAGASAEELEPSEISRANLEASLRAQGKSGD